MHDRGYRRISKLLIPILLLALLAGCSMPLVSISNEEADSQSSGPNCLVTGNGTGFSSSGGGDGIPPDRVHGEFVWGTLLKYLGQEVDGVSATSLHTIEDGIPAELVVDQPVFSDTNRPVVILVVDEFTNPEDGIVYSAPSQLYRVEGDRYILVESVDITQFNLVQVGNELFPAISKRAVTSSTLDTSVGKIDLPPLKEFVINMSWIVIPCSALPESAALTDYFDLICGTTNEEEKAELSGQPDVSRNVALASRSIFDQQGLPSPDEVNFLDFCRELLPPDANRDAIDKDAKENPDLKKVVVSNFALRGYWLRGLYEGLSDINLSVESFEAFDDPIDVDVPTSLTMPDANFGYETIDCLTFDASAGTLPDFTNRKYTCSNLRDALGLEVDDRVIPVAAAGNDLRPYPYLPAVWDTVLSVGTRNYKSNFAEIMMNGASTHPDEDPDVAWKGGSSFAAPRMSVWTALFLAETRNARCQSAPDVRPVLGIKEDWSDLAADKKNRLLPAALGDCVEFQDLVNSLVAP